MAYEWQSDIIRPDGENGTEVLDGQGVYQPQLEGGSNIIIEDGRINASGTLENVQADYTETDTSAPSYIKHKPDLSIYATASGMETELAGKQDVISDLDTIRSGAASGSTAVQPGDLATVATTGSYTSLTNTPQNIVQDASYVHTDNNFSNADKSKLDGIAAGAEVNVQSDWNEADSSSDAFIKNKPTIPAAQVSSDWNASSGVAQILNKPDLSAYATDTELTDGLATKQDVISDLDTIRSGAAAGATAAQPSDLPSSDELLPSASSGDSGKVLTVNAQGEPGWQTPSSVTVDQTYNASSTNAQSGTAVAQAIASIPSSSYTAGDGIDITSGEISVNAGLGLGINGSSTVTYQPVSPVANIDAYFKGYTTLGQLDADMVAALKNQSSVDLKSLFDIDLSVNSAARPDRVRQLIICTVDSNNNPVISGNRLVFSEDINSSITFTDRTATWPANTTISIPLTIDTTNSNIGWSDVEANPTNYYLTVFTIAGTGAYFTYSTYGIIYIGEQASPAATSEFEAVIPGDNSLYVSNPLPTSTSSDANKVLTVDSNGAAGWQTPASVTVDQTYSASSTNAQSGVAVAQAIAAIPAPSVDEVPDVTSSDDGKVLTAAYSGGVGSYSWQTAQGGGSYTAGDGIDITSDEISVYHDNTLSVTRSYGAASTLEPFSETFYVFETSSDFKGWVKNGSAGEYLRVSIPANAFTYAAGYTACLGIADDNNGAFYPIQLSATDTGSVFVIDAQTVELPLPVGSSTGWEGSVDLTSSNLWLVIAQIQSGSVSGYATYYYTRQSMQVAKSNPGGAIAVTNPLPTSAQADSGKVLKVNASGNAEWGTDSDTTYTAGNMIAINANNSNAIGVSTTAGITDIQQVAALPANPVATVLYLIPET